MIELTFFAFETGKSFTVKTDREHLVQQLKDSLRIGIALISIEEVEA